MKKLEKTWNYLSIFSKFEQYFEQQPTESSPEQAQVLLASIAKSLEEITFAYYSSFC